MVCSPSGPGPSLCLRTTVAATPLRRSTSAVPGGGEDLEAEVGEPLDREDHEPLVAVGHARRRRGALGRQRPVRGGLATWRTPCRRRRRGPSPRRWTSSPGRGRCRPAAVGGAEPVERHHRLLDRDRRVARQRRRRRRSAGSSPRRAASAIVAPSMTRAAALASGVAVALETNGTVAAGPRVGLEDVEHVAGQRELDVDQAAHARRRARSPRSASRIRSISLGAEGDRRQRARRSRRSGCRPPRCAP